MRWSEKQSGFFLYFVMLVCSYLLLVFWYFITRIIHRDIIETSDLLFDVASGLIALVLVILTCYLLYRAYKKFK